MYTPELLYQIIQTLTPDKKFLIAFSGGLDSCVLLHSLYKIRQENPLIEIKAIHINHGVSHNSHFWETHCQKVCNDLKIPLIIKKINTRFGKNLEAELRHLRYNIFANELLEEHACLLTGHHKNDQAETFLLQLFRGAGPKGLAAMPEKMQFSQGVLVRPLLSFTRNELQKYAVENNLCWIEDESNSSLGFDRNYVRHEILPIIQKRWPSVIDIIARSTRHCADASQLIIDFSKKELKNFLGTSGRSLVIDKLVNIPMSQQAYILRAWIEGLHFPLPSETKIRQIQKEVLLARSDSNPKIIWKDTEIRRHKNNLYLIRPSRSMPKNWEISWDLSSPCHLPENLGVLIAQSTMEKNTLKNISQKVVVRFRRGGERCHPLGRQGSHPLKKLFQEWNIPVWERDRIPLVYVENKLAAVVGYCICKEFATTECNQAGFNIVLLNG